MLQRISAEVQSNPSRLYDIANNDDQLCCQPRQLIFYEKPQEVTKTNCTLVFIMVQTSLQSLGNGNTTFSFTGNTTFAIAEACSIDKPCFDSKGLQSAGIGD